MKQLNRKMECEIVQDLMPLYIDGDCTESSRIFVQKHLRECASCQKQLNAMREPLNIKKEEPCPLPEEIKPAKKAISRIRRRTIIVTAIVMALLIPFVLMGIHQVTGRGIAYGNIADIVQTKKVMETWKTEGLSSVVESFTKPEQYYDSLLEQKAEWSNPEEEFSEYTIDGTVYMIRDTLWSQLGDYSDLSPDKLSDMSEEDFWYAVLCGESERSTQLDAIYVAYPAVPADIYEALTQKYGASFFGSASYNMNFITTDCGNYYVFPYSKEDLCIDFTEDMKTHVPGVHQMDEISGIGLYTPVLTSDMYDAYVEEANTINQWYAAYADYYRNLGEEEFIKLWNEGLKQELEMDSPLCDVTLTDYEYVDTFKLVDSWNVVWLLTFSNGIQLELGITEDFVIDSYDLVGNSYERDKGMQLFTSLNCLFDSCPSWLN